MRGTVITAACSILLNAAIDNGIPLVNIRGSNRGTLRVQGERRKRVEYHIVASAMFVGLFCARHHWKPFEVKTKHKNIQHKSTCSSQLAKSNRLIDF